VEAIFAEGGYDSFSMAKLSEKAGVVKGTLYL
jgi:AcrR family transcriptional regulator